MDVIILFLAIHLILREKLDICVRDDLFFGLHLILRNFFFGLHLILRTIGRNMFFQCQYRYSELIM